MEDKKDEKVECFGVPGEAEGMAGRGPNLGEMLLSTLTSPVLPHLASLMCEYVAAGGDLVVLVMEAETLNQRKKIAFQEAVKRVCVDLKAVEE